MKLRQEFDSGQLKKVAPDEAKISLLLEDGTTYPHEGKLLFSDVTVDPTTGMVTLRAEFPNPDDLLLPGMFARAQLEQAVDSNAITVPQRGVTYGANGNPTVMVVTPDNKVEIRPVTVSSADGQQLDCHERIESRRPRDFGRTAKSPAGNGCQVPCRLSSTNAPAADASN